MICIPLGPQGVLLNTHLFWLLSLYINGFTERWKGLEKPLEREAFRKIFSQVSHQFKQVPPNFRDHLRGPHFDCGFHLSVPSPAASACFPEWKLAQRDNWCATGTLLIAARHLTQKQTARAWISMLREKKNPQHAKHNCYYYPIFRRSDKTQLFNTKGAEWLQICSVYIHQVQILMLYFLAAGPSHNAFILSK